VFGCFLTLLTRWLAVAAVDKPPYEVSKSGWGEFDIQIKIFFVDPAEKPVRAAVNAML